MAPVDWLVFLRTCIQRAHIITAVLLLAIGLFVWSLKANVVRGQVATGVDDPCDGLTQEAFQIYQEAGTGEDQVVLVDLARTTAAAEECYGGSRVERRLWLRRVRIWALDGGKRYREAARLTEEAWSGELYEAADSLSAVNLLRSLVRYRSFGGEFDAALEALDEARPLIEVLAHEGRLHVRLTEASLHLDRGHQARAQGIAERVLQEVRADTAANLDFVRARALLISAEARMEAETWDEIAADLEAAAGVYRRLGMVDRLSVALADLGEVYAETDRRRSEAHLAEALAIARADSNAKSEIFVRYRRGRVGVRARLYDEAARDFERALALAHASGIHKYTADLEYELARLSEARNALAAARRRYEALAAQAPRFGEGGVRAVVLRERAAARGRELGNVILVGRLKVGLLGALAAAMALAVVSVMSRLALAQERWQREVAGRAAGRQMLFYMSEVVLNPGRVAESIRKKDRDLARRLGRWRLRSRGELYQCVALFIFAVEGRTITHDWVRISLDRLFKSNNWDWPDSVESWKEHIENRPAE